MSRKGVVPDRGVRKLVCWYWRDSSVGKGNGYFCRRPRLDSQQPHGGSKTSVNSVPGDLTAPPGLRGHQACTQTYMQEKHAYT